MSLGSPSVKPNVTRSTLPTCWACTDVSVGSTTRGAVTAGDADSRGSPSPRTASSGAKRADLDVMTTSCVWCSYDALGRVDVDRRDATTCPGDDRDARLVGGVRLAVHGERRDVHEVAGVRVEVAVEALEL